MGLIKFILDIIIPRLVTERVALIYDKENEFWEVLCLKSDLRDGEYYDVIATSKCFNFFGIGLFPTIIFDAQGD